MKAINFKTLYAQVSRWAFPLLVILFLLSLVKCNENAQRVGDLELNLDSMARLASHFENERGQVVSENKQIKAASSAQIRQLTDSIFSLKKENERRIKQVTQYARIIQRLELRDRFAPFIPEPADTTGRPVALAPAQTRDTSHIPVPQRFAYNDTTTRTYFGGRVTFRGVFMDSITVENTLHYRTVTNKTGFLGLGRSTTVQVLNSNPDVKTVGVTSVAVPHKVGWWHKWGKPALFAILGGVAVDQFRK
jgi:hypothetical protein